MHSASNVGMRIRCPACNFTFPVPPLVSEPNKASSQEHQAPETPVIHHDRGFSGSRTYQFADARARRKRDRNRANSFFEFIVYMFDPTFSKYVTPWIIRVTWTIVLLLVAYSLILYAFDDLGEAIGWNFSPPDTEAPNAKAREVVQLIYKWVLRVSIAVLALLWTRVWLETCIVIFDISSTLKQISKNE